MKILTITLIITCMLTSLFSTAQKTVYDKNASKKEFTSEDIDISFSGSGLKFKKAEAAGLVLSLIPTAIDFAFKTTTKILEKRVKKFTAEYTKQKSYLEAGNGEVPNFHLIRKVTVDGSEQEALDISFKAAQIDGINAFVYYVEAINLTYSAAKSVNKSKVFDYAIEIKVTTKTKDEANVVNLAPIVVSSTPYGANNFIAKKHRSDIISMPAGAVITQVSIKILETNPVKVRAEKIVSLWNDNKDDIKTVINNFLPESKKETSKEEGADAGSGSGGNQPAAPADDETKE